MKAFSNFKRHNRDGRERLPLPTLEFLRQFLRRCLTWAKTKQGRGYLILSFVSTLALAICIHFREVRVDNLELNSLADQYVVAQIDFSFLDEEGTSSLKQAAIEGLGTIYKVDDQQLHRVCKELEKQVRPTGERGYLDPELKAYIESSSFDKSKEEELERGITFIHNALIQLRFTNEKCLQKMKECGASTAYAFLYASLGEGETHQQGSLPFGSQGWPQFWSHLGHEMERSFSLESRELLLSYFQKQNWQFQEDVNAIYTLRKSIQDKIPPKYTSVHKGSHLIDPGERVTPHHIAMQKAMKQALGENRMQREPFFSSILFALVATGFHALYLRINHKRIFQSIPSLSLLVTIVILTLILAKGVEYFVINKTNSLVDLIRYPLLVPFTTILVCILVGSEVALFTSGFVAIVLRVFLAIEHDRFLVVNLIATLVAIISARSLHKRKEVFGVCGKVWLSVVPLILGFHLLEAPFWHVKLGVDLLYSLVCMLSTAILIAGLLPVLESLFDVMTDMTLMEYMDPNNELLRRLSVEAPGTYQHSLVVGNLAESAARAIGANGLFCRVSTLYHDIGKLFNPYCFTENQSGGLNIHQLLTPLESTQVIIAHVTEGEILGKKYRLPQSFMDIIREHHGDTLVYYFYCKQVEFLGGDIDSVDEDLFRYPGPKPHTKESAIIMIADTIEAASRSMEGASEEVIAEMVDKLVQEKADDGQFDECQLTFEELGVIKKTITKTLAVTKHLRVKYPSLERV